MSLIVHDLNKEDFNKIYDGQGRTNDMIIGPDTQGAFCTGCLKCFADKFSNCIFDDAYSEISNELKKSGEVIIISECIYGCYSAKVKLVFERAMTYLQPYFTIIQGRDHHKIKNKGKINYYIHFYGKNLTEEEKENASLIARENAFEWNVKKNYVCKVFFFETVREIKLLI